MLHRILWWDGQKGLAIFDGVQAELRAAPRLPGVHLLAIDYASRIHLRQIALQPGQPWRAMTDDEVFLVDAMLGRMVNAVRQELS
jgi:hypothetical protein